MGADRTAKKATPPRMAAGLASDRRGDNTAVPEWVTTDLAGWSRMIKGRVDMGAYETPLTAYLPLVLQ